MKEYLGRHDLSFSAPTVFGRIYCIFYICIPLLEKCAAIPRLNEHQVGYLGP